MQSCHVRVTLLQRLPTRLTPCPALCGGRLPDKSYLMRLGGFTYVDARERPTCLARYINDCRNPLGHNVRFDKVRAPSLSSPSSPPHLAPI